MIGRRWTPRCIFSPGYDPQTIETGRHHVSAIARLGRRQCEVLRVDSDVLQGDCGRV